MTTTAAGSSAAQARKKRRSGPQPFDFRRPNKISREHVRALQIVNETFARQFQTILSTTLRTVATVTVSSVDHLAYDEYVRSSPNPSYLALLSLQPLSGAGILQMPLPIVMTTLDRLLGGTGEGKQPQRELTDLELPLVRDLTVRLLRELDYAFETLTALHSEIVQVESNPQFAQICAPSDMVMVASFDVRIASTESVATLCLPMGSLQPVLEQVTARSSFSDRKEHDAAATTAALAGSLTGAPVEVAVRFDPVRLTSAEIRGLRPGDVLPLRHAVSSPLTVSAAGRPLASAVPGSKGRHLAFLVVPSPTHEEHSR